MKPGGLEVEVKLNGFERLERVAEMVDKIKVLEELGPNDRLVLSARRGITAIEAQEIMAGVAEAFGIDPASKRILLLTEDLEIEAIFRAHDVRELTPAEARAWGGLPPVPEVEP